MTKAPEIDIVATNIQDSLSEDNFSEVDSSKDDLSAVNSKNLFRLKLKMISLGVLGIIIVSLALIFLLKSKSTPVAVATHETITLDSGSTALDIDKMWRHKVEENMVGQNKNLTDKIDGLKDELTKASTAQVLKKDEEIHSLKEKLKFLEAEIDETKKSHEGVGQDGLNQDGLNQASLKLSGSNVSGSHANANEVSTPGISVYKVNLTNSKNSKDYQPVKTPDNYIAAGSFAGGVLLSGLDVSTSIKTASDPEPVLIRVTNFGTLPRKFSSDLKDCHIVGSAYGDLSSERAKIRIEKLSCVEIKTAEVVETEIAGYVSGEDGRAGLRGIIVSVDQKYMVNAQIFGTLGGLASSSTPSPTSYNPFTVASGAVRPQSAQQNLTSGLLNGASNSLDKISDYYIDRAESIQPVVQVAAGREIDIIFTEGVYFGTSNLKRSISQKRDEKMRQTGEMDQFQLDHSRPEQSKSNKLNLSGE